MRQILPAAAVLLTFASTPARAQAAAELPPLSIRTPLYEIHASDSASLHATRADVEHAIAQFRRHVGETPAPLAVVVLDGDGGMAAVDDRPFRARGFHVLPWLTDAALRRVAGDAAPDAGLGGTHVGRAVAHEACHVYLRAHVDRLQGRAPDEPRLRGAYGHEDVPDWLDEAVASLCESDAARAGWATEMRGRMGERLALAELLAMPHPGAPPATIGGAGGVPAGTPRIVRRDGQPLSPEDEARIRRSLAGDESTGLTLRRATDGTTPPPGVITQVRQLSPEELAASGRVLVFYAQSLSVARFVAARAGDAAVGRLVAAAAAGQPVTEALAALPGLPAGLPALEAAWLAWAQGEGAAA